LESLANIDLAALDTMDAALSASRYLPGLVSVPAPQVGIETSVPQAGPSSLSGPSSISFAKEPTPVVDTVMDHPGVAVLPQSSPAPEIPVEDEEPGEDELAMSGVEDATGDIVGDEVKGAYEA